MLGSTAISGTRTRLLAPLLAAATLTLASCGGNAGGGDKGDMQGMDHGGSGGGMAGMDHSDMGHGEMGSKEMAQMSREMVMPNGEYSDKAFIDAMVPHHEGAVEMAEVALERAEHPEIRNLAEEIISAQRAEIEMFGEIRQEKFGSAEGQMDMNEQDMQAMGMSDPQELAKADPFDKAFIDDMIPHHESAIAMAEVARKNTDDPEIREIANDIVSAQEREIGQMERWRQQWYPEG